MTAPAGWPPARIQFDAELTPEQVEEFKARWKAAWAQNRHRPPVILPPDSRTDAQDLRAGAAVLERRLKAAGKRSFLISVWASAMRRYADRLDAS